MSIVADYLMLSGGVVAALAGIGVLRFKTPYASFHAAGKASPVAFLLAAVGAALELGGSGAALLAVAGGAMAATLPIGVHLLFRGTHRTASNHHLVVDELADHQEINPEP